MPHIETIPMQLKCKIHRYVSDIEQIPGAGCGTVAVERCIRRASRDRLRRSEYSCETPERGAASQALRWSVSDD